jgi:hypothetical protein
MARQSLSVIVTPGNIAVSADCDIQLAGNTQDAEVRLRAYLAQNPPQNGDHYQVTDQAIWKARTQ